MVDSAVDHEIKTVLLMAWTPLADANSWENMKDSGGMETCCPTG